MVQCIKLHLVNGIILQKYGSYNRISHIVSPLHQYNTFFIFMYYHVIILYHYVAATIINLSLQS